MFRQLIHPIVVMGYECFQCGHKWRPRNPEPPAVCPKCKDNDWQKPRLGKPVVRGLAVLQSNQDGQVYEKQGLGQQEAKPEQNTEGSTDEPV